MRSARLYAICLVFLGPPSAPVAQSTRIFAQAGVPIQRIHPWGRQLHASCLVCGPKPTQDGRVNDINDPMPPAAEAPHAAPPKKTAVQENTQGLARVLLILFATTALLGGGYALVASMSALRDIGVLGGFIVALLPVVALPAFLTIRAGLALKRRGMGAVVRRLVGIALVLLTHLAVIGVVTEWVGRTTGDFFATSYLALEEIGGVPYFSPMLKRAAKERDALPLPGDDPDAVATGPDGGPLPLVDGGPVPTPAAPADGGPAAIAPLVAPPAVDAGATTAPTPAVVPGALAPREEGGARVLFAVSTAKKGSSSTLVVHELFAKGAHHQRHLNLDAHRAGGSIRRVESANDGTVVVLQSSGAVLLAPPSGALTPVVSLAPGAKVSSPDGADAGAITSVRDVVVGPGGDLVAVVDVALSRGKAPRPSLVAATVNSATATLVRQRGDAIDDEDKKPANLSYDFALRRSEGSDRFVVVETFTSGAPVRTNLSGATFKMNPQRLLTGSVRAPAGLREVARTGAAVMKLKGKTLQAFQDAVPLADGRVLFDANFVEAGREGWVFIATPGESQVYALSYAKFPNKAPWGTAAPRARSLTASDADYFFVTGDDDHSAIVRGEVSGAMSKLQVPAQALGFDRAWRVSRFHSVALADGGEWVLIMADVYADDDVKRRALLTAKMSDYEAGTFSVVVVEGMGSTPLSRLSFHSDRRDPLWMMGP